MQLDGYIQGRKVQSQLGEDILAECERIAIEQCHVMLNDTPITFAM